MAKVKIYLDPIANTMNIWWDKPSLSTASVEVDSPYSNDVIITNKQGVPIGLEIIGVFPDELNVASLVKKQLAGSRKDPFLLESQPKSWINLQPRTQSRTMEEASTLLSETGPFPYEDGDHCMFYALQDASLFFRQKDLDTEYREQLANLRDRGPQIARAITGKDEIPGEGTRLSLFHIARKLKKMDISPTRFICQDPIHELIKDTPFFRNIGLQIEKSANVKMDYPVMIFTANNSTGQRHVWFCKDKNDFDQNNKSHLIENDEMVGFLFFNKHESSKKKKFFLFK